MTPAREKPITRSTPRIKTTEGCCDIGTPLAQQALSSIASQGSGPVVEYARKRLRNWDRERDRKGTSETA